MDHPICLHLDRYEAQELRDYLNQTDMHMSVGDRLLLAKRINDLLKGKSPMIFFTSDTHFGHVRIIDLCDRPFASVDEMNEQIIERWNSVVSEDDIVFHLGDVALGRIDDSLPLVGRLNGYKILVNGNHDRPFMNSRKPEKFVQWEDRYFEVFQEQVHGAQEMVLNGVPVRLCHFPYDGDSHGDDRYADERPEDDGRILIHGHTHLDQIVSHSKAGTLQIHVGQDAFDYTPVSEDQIMTIIENNR